MDEERMLNEIRKSTQMGNVGIDCVLNRAQQPQLRNALSQQRAEYQQLQRQADSLLSQRKALKQSVNPMARVGAQMSAGMKLRSSDKDSKIAEMMIQGNTKGMIKSYRSRATMHVTDPGVQSLSEKLLQTEVHNIEQMKPFL